MLSPLGQYSSRLFSLWISKDAGRRRILDGGDEVSAWMLIFSAACSGGKSMNCLSDVEIVALQDLLAQHVPCRTTKKRKRTLPICLNAASDRAWYLTHVLGESRG